MTKYNVTVSGGGLWVFNEVVQIQKYNLSNKI